MLLAAKSTTSSHFYRILEDALWAEDDYGRWQVNSSWLVIRGLQEYGGVQPDPMLSGWWHRYFSTIIEAEAMKVMLTEGFMFEGVHGA
jgi:hypothetical protein